MSLAGGSALDEELRKSAVIRLRGLPFSATENDIKAFFSGLEVVPDGVVIQINFQGRSTGQAYVQFVDADQANKALERNRQHIGSRYIEVFKGHQADMEGALRMLGRGSVGSTAAVGGGTAAVGGGAAGGLPMFGGPAAAGAGLGAGAGAVTGAGAAGASGSGIPGMGGSADMRFSGVLRMRGMPYSCTASDITAFFKGMAIVPDGIFLMTHADGRPTGEAFVEFVDEETASRAMQLHREPMGSRYVELFRSTKGEMMAAVQHRMYGMLGGAMGSPFMSSSSMMGMMGVPGMGAANLAAMQQMAAYTSGGAAGAALGGQGAMPIGAASQVPGMISDNVCIKMRGLPFTCTIPDILQFFAAYQVVDNGVHIVMGPGDRPTGEAYVEFGSPEEAQRAMEKHRQHIGSRYVELFRVTKSEALVAVQGSSMASFNMAAALDPNMQLLLLQQQQQLQAAALGMGGSTVGSMPGAGGLPGQWGGGMG